MTRILVCGGRKFADVILLRETLDAIVKEKCQQYFQTDDGPKFPLDITIIYGDATGADALAEQWAKDNVVARKKFRAKFQTYGSMAGQIRNTEMLVQGRPDMVVAFPGGNGTSHMAMIADERGIEVRHIRGRRP